MQKREFIWLTRNTDIDNVCQSMKDCATTDVVFKIFRKHNAARLEEIFADYQTERYKDDDDFLYVEVKEMSLNDFAGSAKSFNADILFNGANGKFYYIPVDADKYLQVFTKLSPQTLNKLSPRKKLDMLFALNQECHISTKAQKQRDKFLNKNSEKLNALLDLSIPPDFYEDELRKIRLITAEIAAIPEIKTLLKNFHNLPKKQQKELFFETCGITAKYNRIKTPNLCFISNPKMKKITQSDWVDADGFSVEKNIFINTGKLRQSSGIQCLALIWHETNHIAQSFADYTKYPIMEDILSHRLNYLNEFKDVYIMHPQEKVNYALEKQFIEECVARTGIAPDSKNFLPRNEYDVATQYMAKSMQRKY